MADPYDGYNRTLPASPFLPAVLAACGVPAFSHGVRSVGPKFGATHHQVLHAAGVAVDDSPQRVAARLEDPAIGWGYVDQSRFCPKLYALTELRRLMVKRPAITTTEVLAGPIKGKSTHLVTGFVHKPYPRIYALPFRRDRLVAFVERGHAWARRRSVALEELAGQRLVLREPGRSGLGSLLLNPGECRLWDNRYRVSLARDSGSPVQVRALGLRGYGELRARLGQAVILPERAADGLVSFWRGGELVAVPPLGFHARSGARAGCSAELVNPCLL